MHISSELKVGIAGFETEACVMATAMRLFEDGANIRVLGNLCDGQHHESALKIMKDVIGEV